MKKRTLRRVHHRRTYTSSPSRKNRSFLTIIRGWMFVVMFALMLGVGAIVGNFINQQLNSAPQVAGAQTEAR